jgi:hypothetical protein
VTFSILFKFRVYFSYFNIIRAVEIYKENRNGNAGR